jgi:hypothetical protein
MTARAETIMRRLAFVTKLLALAGALVSIALLHHGHVMQFIAAVYDSARRKLPPRLRKHEAVVKASLAQVHFGDPAVHYEVWVQRKTRSIEVGLHFEGERADNAHWAEALSERAAEIQAQLGPSAELEVWTRSWTRLHESHPVPGKEWRPKASLTPELVERIAARLARYIEVLEPMLREERKAMLRRGGVPQRARAGGSASRSGSPRRSGGSRPP